MIQIYDASHIEREDFVKNGMPLMPTLCEMTQELNGQIELYIEHPMDKENRWQHLKAGSAVGVPTPKSDKQLFVIYEVDVQINKVFVYARHKYFDLNNRYRILGHFDDPNYTTEYFMFYVMAGTKFLGHAEFNDTKFVDLLWKTSIYCLQGDDPMSAINLYDAEIEVDNFDVYLKKQVGEDKGVIIAFGKNLKEIKHTENREEMATRLIPLIEDNLSIAALSDDGESQEVLSPRLDEYGGAEYVKIIQVDGIKVDPENPSLDDEDKGTVSFANAIVAMKAYCMDRFSEGMDQPTFNTVVDMALLANTTAYKDFAVLETVNLGDTVRCKYLKAGINASQRCIRIVWDCIRKKYSEIELGQFIKNFYESDASKLAAIDNKVSSITKDLYGGFRENNVETYDLGVVSKLIPEGGVDGQVLVRATKGTGWMDAPAGEGVIIERLI